MHVLKAFFIDYWRLMAGRPLLGEASPGDQDRLLSEIQRKYGPVEWDKSVIDKAIEMGRDAPEQQS